MYQNYLHLQIATGEAGWGYLVIQNALPAVDTFFFMSGLLVSYLSLIQMDKKRFNIVLYYVHRIIRLTIPLGLAIAFCIGALPYLSYGPQYNMAVGAQAHRERRAGARRGGRPELTKVRIQNRRSECEHRWTDLLFLYSLSLSF